MLCLGYKGEVIKEYFLGYNEALFNDFTLNGRGAGAEVELLTKDVGTLADHVRGHRACSRRSASA